MKNFTREDMRAILTMEGWQKIRDWMGQFEREDQFVFAGTRAACVNRDVGQRYDADEQYLLYRRMTMFDICRIVAGVPLSKVKEKK